MSQRDFSSELLSQLPPDPATDPDRILRRQRRRIRILSIAIITFWVLALLMIVSMILPLWAKVNSLGKLEAVAGATTVPAQARDVSQGQMLKVLAFVSTWMSVIVTLASLLAAIATVWLVATVRRTTLQQINGALSQISGELKLMQRSA